MCFTLREADEMIAAAFVRSCRVVALACSPAVGNSTGLLAGRCAGVAVEPPNIPRSIEATRLAAGTALSEKGRRP